MKFTHKKRRTVEEVSAIQCDKCGKRVEKDDLEEFQELLSLSFTGGYAAILGDGVSFELDLCQHCVKDVLGPYLRPVSRHYGSTEGSQGVPHKPARV